jgi:DNA-binding transcriptional LysR family regulator
VPVADPPAPLAGLIGETDRRLGPTTADHLYVVVPEGHRLARREAVSVTDLEAEPLILARRATPAGRFRSVVEQLCAQAGFVPRVAYELDDLPAVQSFVAAGIAVVPGRVHEEQVEALETLGLSEQDAHADS